MKALKSATGLLAVLALAAVPSIAAAEVVPPGNSAATQYTEAYPTAGGPAKTGSSKRRLTPSQVLGARNAERLEARGPQGEAAAVLAAATAPPAAAGADTTGAEANRDSAEGRRAAPPSTDGGKPTTASGSDGAKATASSGFEEVIAGATGTSSSGALSPLLLLLLVGVVAWSALYVLRRRGKSVA